MVVVSSETLVDVALYLSVDFVPRFSIREVGVGKVCFSVSMGFARKSAAYDIVGSIYPVLRDEKLGVFCGVG